MDLDKHVMCSQLLVTPAMKYFKPWKVASVDVNL